MLAVVIAWMLGAPPQISQMADEVRRRPTAAGVRALADAYVRAGRFADASATYVRASSMYAKLGDPNAAKIFTDLANRYRTSVSFFVDRPVPGGPSPALAKFEPVAGCYVGANIEREEATRDPEEFNRLVGKHHAIFFMYRRYGVAFPRQFAASLAHAGSSLQLSLEPDNLDQVQDDAYLRGFAQDAQRSGIPIFLRYACEMNGDWTPYHGNSARYVEKFRLVASVMHDLAPNVAMVWCPNEIPEAPIPAYFPGDDAVDWVGVNFYSEIFNDADRSRGAEWRHPEDAVDYVYARYSARHPIMVGEWAATHRSIVDDRERPEFAAAKIAQFYSAIPRLYPRVKAVSWLSLNAFKYAQGGRRLNDYSLLDNDQVAAAYTGAVSSPYFLENVSDAPKAETAPTPLDAAGAISAAERLSVYVRSYDPAPTVTVRLGETEVARFRAPGPCEFTLPPSTPSGAQTLTAEVRDTQGNLAGRFSTPVRL